VSLPPTEPPSEDFSLTCDLTGSVFPPPISSHQCSMSISSPTLSFHDTDHPSSTPAGYPKHLPPYSPSTVVTIVPEPSAPQEPTLPALPSAPATPSPFSSTPASHTCSHISSQAHPVLYMLTCFFAGLQTASHRAVNFDKFREIIQHSTKNSADFLGCLTETLTHYTLS
jgi:hypothetical protein